MKEQLQPERGVRICEKKKSADTKASEGGGGGAPCSRAAHGADHSEAGCAPEAHGGL